MSRARKPKLGRPALPAAHAMSSLVRVRCTPGQFKQFEKMGGAEWLRALLDRETVKELA